MTERELKKLGRTELLELLLVQTKEVERLQIQLEEARQKLHDRYLQIQETGDLAHAVLAVNGVMEAAQAAARQYLDNISKMEADARLQCENMLAEARNEADRIRRDAGLHTKFNSHASSEEERKISAAEGTETLDETEQLLVELHQLLREEQ